LPELIRSANEAMHSSAPIIRPLWMVDPLNPVTHTIDDQFLIGDKVKVKGVFAFWRNVDA
jgi:alpha-glucosidase (family GH31 glycosyl hydrolase)